jgi:hypothetical protein
VNDRERSAQKPRPVTILRERHPFEGRILLHRSKKALFDYFVGASEQQERQSQVELLCSFLVHDQLKFRWGLNRQFGRIGTT